MTLAYTTNHYDITLAYTINHYDITLAYSTNCYDMTLAYTTNHYDMLLAYTITQYDITLAYTINRYDMTLAYCHYLLSRLNGKSNVPQDDIQVRAVTGAVAVEGDPAPRGPPWRWSPIWLDPLWLRKWNDGK